MARPLFKTEALRLVSNVQLVKCPYTVKLMANTILLFFGSNQQHTLLLRPLPSVISTAVPYKETDKQ